MQARAGWTLAVMLVSLLTCGAAGEAGAAGEEKPIWLAVGPKPLVQAVAGLAAHREKEGYEVRLVSGGVEEALSALPRAPAFLLLVGDDLEKGGIEPWRVPARRRTLYRWRAAQPEEFASDSVYGDTDGDLIPDFPVGRIPARTPEEVARVVEKILAFEARDPVRDDLRIVGWAGAPGYGAVIDSMATGLLISTVRRHAPEWAGTFLLSSREGDPLCGHPPEQPLRFTAEWRAGSVLAAVVAHASARSVHLMRYEGGSVRFGQKEAEAAFAAGPPVSPLVLLTCDSGRFSGETPCLAERLLLLPGGPVAVIAATTESHPLPNFFTGQCLLDALQGGTPRLGEVWLRAQREGRNARSLLIERMLRGAEGSLEPEIDVAKLRRDQPLLYAILGDPATRLKLPDPLEAEVAKIADGWRFRATPPEGATQLEVGHRPFRPAHSRAGKRPASPEAARAAFEGENEAGAFRVLSRLDAGGEWAGVVAEPGTLRLVATGPGMIQVFTAELGR